MMEPYLLSRYPAGLQVCSAGHHCRIINYSLEIKVKNWFHELVLSIGVFHWGKGGVVAPPGLIEFPSTDKEIEANR